MSHVHLKDTGGGLEQSWNERGQRPGIQLVHWKDLEEGAAVWQALQISSSPVIEKGGRLFLGARPRRGLAQKGVNQIPRQAVRCDCVPEELAY